MSTDNTTPGTMQNALRKFGDTQAAKARVFDAIADLLFPVEEPDREWDQGTIEEVGRFVEVVYPNVTTGDRTLTPNI